MDIYSAVEQFRTCKKDISSSINLAAALYEIAAIRKRKNKAWRRREQLIEKLNSSHLVSGIYGATVSVQTSANHEKRQEILAECSDLARSVREDIALLYDAIELVEDTIEAIPDRDTREIIDGKYLKGLSDTEINNRFRGQRSGYAQELERRYFRSLAAAKHEQSE